MRKLLCFLALGAVCAPCLLAQINGCANSTLVNNLGAAGPSNFAVFSMGGSGSELNINLATVTGNVGVANPGKIIESAPSVVTRNIIVGSQVDTSGVHGSYGLIVINDDLVTQAASDASTAAAYFAGLPTTAAVQAQFPSNGQITSNLTVTGMVGMNVVNLPGFLLASNATLTLTGPAGTGFVINISGNFNMHTGTIQTADGVAPMDVVYNITGANARVTTMVPTTGVGIILAPNSNINSMDSSSFRGEIIGGYGKMIVLMSGSAFRNPCSVQIG